MNKYIEKFRKDVKKLDEAKQVGLLYHCTTVYALEKILKSNKMIAYQDRGIAFSSNKMEFFANYPVQLVVDGDKLSENYKVTRLQGAYHEVNVVGKGRKPLYLTGKKDEDNEAYEQMTSDDNPHVIYNIKNYIVGFMINKKFCENDDFEQITNTIKTYLPNAKIEILDTEKTDEYMGRGLHNSKYKAYSVRDNIVQKLEKLIKQDLVVVTAVRDEWNYDIEIGYNPAKVNDEYMLSFIKQYEKYRPKCNFRFDQWHEIILRIN